MPQISIKQQNRGPAVKLFISVVAYKSDSARVTTAPIEIDESAMVMLRFQRSSLPTFKMDVDVGVRASQRAVPQQANQSTMKVKANFNTNEKEVICSDSWSEFVSLGETLPDFEIQNPNGVSGLSFSAGELKGAGIYLFTLEVNISVQDVTHLMNLNNPMLNDNRFFDLNLIATDEPQAEPVKVHRFVMGSHSELFQNLLLDPDRLSDRNFPIRGVTHQTLVHLRDYMYRGILPFSGIPQLLLLAKSSEMKKLKDDSIRKLASMVEGNDLDNIIEFSIEHKIPDLLRAMLSFTPDSAIHIAHQLRRHRLVFRPRNLQQLALGWVPNNGIPQLLLLAKSSEMKKLKDDSIRKLASMVEGNDLDNIIEFAIEHKIPDLLRAMLSFTPDSAIHNAHQLRRHRLVFRPRNLQQLALGWVPNNGQE